MNVIFKSGRYCLQLAACFAAVSVTLSSQVAHAVSKASALPDAPTGISTESSDKSSVELGVKFQSRVNAQIDGVRFYRTVDSANGFTATLFDSSGKVLASSSIGAGSQTLPGYVRVLFKAPVNISANHTYLVSYHAPSGQYSFIANGFKASIVKNDITLLSDSAAGGNGVYTYSTTSVMPQQSYQGSNYMVDVIYSNLATPTPTPTPVSSTGSTLQASVLPDTPLGVSTESSDKSSVELGVKFQSRLNVQIDGVRFYRTVDSANGYTASLFDSSGKLLASKSVSAGSQTLPGYVRVLFNMPININADQTYVISYHAPTGQYSYIANGFNSSIIKNDITLLSDSAAGGNGVYTYSTSTVMPRQSYQASNYMVDVIYSNPAAPTATPAPVPTATPIVSSTTFTLGQRPFASDSSWNTPISSSASYTTLNWPATTGYNYGANWDSYAPAVVLSKPSDPIVTVSYPAGWGYPGGTLNLRIPKGVTGASGSDGELLVIDGNTVHNFWIFNRTSDTSASAESYGRTNVLTGSGWGSKSPFLSAGIVATGSSQLAGLLVKAETDGGEIQHAIQIMLDFSLALPGFTGEAISGDGSSSRGISREGERLAILPTAAMPAGLSPLGQKVFRAFQRYGAFNIDVSGFGGAGIRVQQNAYDGATVDSLRTDMNKLIPMLKRVN